MMAGREEKMIYSVTSPSLWLPLVDYSPPSLYTSLPISHFHHLSFSVLPSTPPTLCLSILSHSHAQLSSSSSFFLHIHATSPWFLPACFLAKDAKLHLFRCSL